MENIAKRLNAYITAHPFDSGDSNCELSWSSFTKLTQNPMKATRRKSATALRNWTRFWSSYLWMIIMQYGTSVANSIWPTNAKLSSTASNTARI